MGSAESGTLVDKGFYTLENQKNFLANMEQVDPSTAYSVVDKLKSKSGSVSRYVLMTKGKAGTVSSWQTKHLFISSWVVGNIPFEQHKFIRHTYQGVEFISINMDACSFNYMTSFMDLVMFFLSKEEFLNRIVDLCNNSDSLMDAYVKGPYDEPQIEKPIYATATPSFYAVSETSNQNAVVTREHPNNQEITLSSSVREMESESSAPFQRPYIPELDDLEFTDTESSFIPPIQEYSSTASRHSAAASSAIDPISDNDIESDVSGAFVNGRYYKSNQSRTSTSMSRGSKVPSVSSAYSRSSKIPDFQISDSGTMDGTISQNESESSRSRNRHRSRNIKDNIQGSHVHSKIDGDELDLSDTPQTRRQRKVDYTSDSIIFDHHDSLNESSSTHSSRRSRRSRTRTGEGSKQSSGSKRRQVELPQRVDDALDLSTDSTASRSSRMQSTKKPKRQDTAGDEILSMETYSRSSAVARKKRYAGSTYDNEQVPMSSDTGLADQESKGDFSSKDFSKSRSSRSSRVSSHTGDTNPVHGDFETKTTGQLRSGNTNIKSKDFANYMGTGTSSGHRAIHNDASNHSSSLNADSRTDSHMKTNSSDFSTNKFQPFVEKREQIETEGSFLSDNHKSASKRFPAPHVDYYSEEESSDF
jgi:hypothetical protein